MAEPASILSWDRLVSAFVFRSAFKSPLRRLLGKKPDKKIAKESSDVIEEGDGLSLVSCVLFTDTGGAQKVSEGEFGDLALNTVHLFFQQTNAAGFLHPA